MTVHDIPLSTLAGQPASLGDLSGRTLLVVNVASKCGLTPQYEGLERLHERYGDRGFSVVGFPCNQFGGQEPGTAGEIQEFCSATYGELPLVREDRGQWARTASGVRGTHRGARRGRRGGRHPVELREVPGRPGWGGHRAFRPRTDPEDSDLVAAIEANLPG